MLGKLNEGLAHLDTDSATVDCRRASPRLNQRDRRAAVVRGSGKTKIRVLNLSRSGIMAECQAPPAVGERVGIALDDADPVSATTLWVQGRRFGAEFASAVAFETLWPPATPYRTLQPAQPGADRIVVDVGAIVHRLDEVSIQARIRNVSVRGMLVETAEELIPRQLVEVEADGWACGATVMWRRNGNVGLKLHRPLTEVEMLGLKVASSARRVG